MPKIAFLFPGQGAQFAGMGKQLCQTVPAARQLFDEARDVLGYDLADVCANGPLQRLDSTAVSQPAIFVASLAALASLQATSPEVVAGCQATAGLSLGEYTALVFAGAMSFRDGLRVVQQRGLAMQAAADATPSGMVAVLTLDRDRVLAICEQARAHGGIQIANLLCPGNTVVSGSLAACEVVERLATEAGGTAKRLAVAGAFHTDLMKPADATLERALASVEFHSPRIAVWSNVDAKPHTDPEEIRRNLVRQVLHPVLWEQTIRELLAAGCDRFYEIGSGRVLASLLKRVQRKAECINVPAD